MHLSLFLSVSLSLICICVVVNSLGLVKKMEYLRNVLGVRAYMKLRRNWRSECQGSHLGKSGKQTLKTFRVSKTDWESAAIIKRL